MLVQCSKDLLSLIIGLNKIIMEYRSQENLLASVGEVEIMLLIKAAYWLLEGQLCRHVDDIIPHHHSEINPTGFNFNLESYLLG